ncbi:hypothetical protein Msil_1871 [Methylocella silvestris BL2]|uniref:Uncharacterized protein n=1 Tax=Methylocella silvestris (strain DSM 15510 / CIP 108128 / LMG 27833 / NCIMB 13906 / BL2) TaxID=395965 RepID=B8ENN0_METSB|nr:hypothetical protein [Methylocella silvestris]ACK50816.1 hypothetical protein Msil_1871 [Methylocella silvestris BL2]
MPTPIPVMLRKGLHAVTQKLVAEVLVSVFSTLLVMMLVSHLTKPAPDFAAVDLRVAAVPALAPNESGDATADFLERVALSHIVAPRAAALEAAAEPAAGATGAAAPLPPRRRAALLDHSQAGKDRVAANVQASAPINAQANIQSNAPGNVPQALAAHTPAAASAPSDWIDSLNPLKYSVGLVSGIGAFVSASHQRAIDGGGWLVSGIGEFVSASDKRLVEGMASVGDSVTALVKKPKS